MRIGVLSTLAILFCSRRGRPHHIEMALCAGTGLRYAIAYCEPVPNSIAPWMRVGGGQARASLCESRDPVPASTRAFDRCDFGVLASLAFLFCSRLEARTTPSEIATVNVQARKPAPQSNAINLFLLSASICDTCGQNLFLLHSLLNSTANTDGECAGVDMCTTITLRRGALV